MYVAGFVIPVPEEKLEAYLAWARRGGELLKELGCIEIVESWEDNVPDGKRTDFRRAVAARAGEKIVFAWQIWPDKATLDEAEARIRTDPRFALPAEIPFDPQRLIFGSFRPIHAMRRS